MEALLAGQRALVTGASRGIGRATAFNLAQAGAQVWALARSETDLHSLAADHDAITPLICDLTDSAALSEVKSTCGTLSILVNNAGWASPRTRIEKSSPGDWQRTLQTCLYAPMILTHAFLPEMLASESAAIVQILSPAARRGRAGEAAYAAAKAGLRAFSESLRAEVAHRGVRVLSIYPGHVDTDLIPFNRNVDRTAFLQPADVADAIVAAVLDESAPPEITIGDVGHD